MAFLNHRMLVPRLAAEKTRFENLPARRRILILGSTGSIGRSALELLEQHPDLFEVVGLAAYGSQPQILADQIRKFRPKAVAVFDKESKAEIELLSGSKISCGEQAISDLCQRDDIDIVLAAIVGVAGLPPVLSALKAGKQVALANKESLVVAGKLVRDLAAANGAQIIPVDSEHSGVFQSLQAASDSEVSSLVLTASGGPFLRKSSAELGQVTVEQAINHPRWKMGAKISVDSATLMNKGLELIEAHYLFGLPSDRLAAVIHPQSIVHAILNFVDGSSLMQVSTPDMKEPIAYALNYPRPRMEGVLSPLNFSALGSLDFEQVDAARFPAVNLALKCINSGPEACLVFNEANEQAVACFFSKQIRFTDIVPFTEEVLSSAPGGQYSDYQSLQQYRTEVLEVCQSLKGKFAQISA